MAFGHALEALGREGRHHPPLVALGIGGHQRQAPRPEPLQRLDQRERGGGRGNPRRVLDPPRQRAVVIEPDGAPLAAVPLDRPGLRIGQQPRRGQHRRQVVAVGEGVPRAGHRDAGEMRRDPGQVAQHRRDHPLHHQVARGRDHPQRVVEPHRIRHRRTPRGRCPLPRPVPPGAPRGRRIPRAPPCAVTLAWATAGGCTAKRPLLPPRPVPRPPWPSLPTPSACSAGAPR